MVGRIRVGVGGWNFEGWRGRFFPPGLSQKRELEYAASKLTTIEVNGTFYRTQKPATFAKWRSEVPDGFVFALKAPRYAVNKRVLAEAGESIGWFVDSGIAELGDALGPINWQFAATKKLDLEDFAAFLGLLPKEVGGRRLRHALEVRHPSFDDPDLLALAAAHGAAVIVAGDSDYPRIEAPTADFVYARIMGTTAGEAAGYSEAALDAWAAWAKAQAADGRDAFLYVISGEKALNPAAAMALSERVA
jgi:uncharacterized protein YecE (DUF72 family)